jgi:GMP synthase-like glutamine amidotransferase
MVIRLRKQSKMAAMELAAVAGVSCAHKRRRVAYLSAAYAEQVFKGRVDSLPQGAHWLPQRAHCAHQAFVLGPHLALQCPIEYRDDLGVDACGATSGQTNTPAQAPWCRRRRRCSKNCAL